MNKFLTFLATGFIAILGVFSVNGSTKNAAEPQYFLKNREIQNAAVDKSSETKNIIDFYFDSNTNYYELISPIHLLAFNNNTEVYYYNENATLVKLNYYSPEINTLTFDTNYSQPDLYQVEFSAQNFYIMKINQNFNDEGIEVESDQWYINLNDTDMIKVKGFRVINFEYYDNQNINTINCELSKFIGNLTELEKTPQSTTTNSLDQIGKIISDAIQWFVDIFSGLSEAFVTTTETGTELTVWGSVLFIGVAIYLVSMCLVCVISLIKGV